MTDKEITDLYFARSENAIHETAKKYGKYCHTIADRILHSREDSEECVSDTYMKAWETIPPKSPAKLSAYLGKITRNFAIKRYEKRTAEKRAEGELSLALDELTECIPSNEDTEHTVLLGELTRILNAFLSELPTETRKIFMQRYFYLSSVKEIATDLHMKENNVRIILFRARGKLKDALEKEGVEI
jgi:RNA polymerase sigma-70 factor (ECF subfamily)